MNQNKSERLSRFISLLEGIFELDKADLDFGIYRIMNIRKDEIKQFLVNDLPKKVQDALEPFAADTGKITDRIAAIEKQAAELGIEIDASPTLSEEYARLKSQLAAGTDLSSLEADVYSALYSFFNRYYDEGDFISKRRYKEGVYAIPYEGEEIKLYWANADQYYIKTAENFQDYTFIDSGKTVHFQLVEATTEKNNNKESDKSKREFMLYTETPDRPELKTVEEINGELVIRFVYDVPADKKVKWAEVNLAVISEAIAKQFKGWYHLLAPVSGAKKETRTILEKHLTAYVAKNTFDYFIHKDLRGFLTRELDFFIKSEVIHLDEIDTTDEKRADSYLAKVRAIKRVGRIIIDFLAQIEDFQKKLWLKKKFVVDTNWCITLDKIDEAFYPEIIANAAQIAEWRDMCAIHEIQGNHATVGYSEPLTADFLCQNKNLVLDTRHFTADFKDQLIASVDNLDEQTGGLLVHSENFQALRLLMERYRRQVDGIYIDPPYNTESDRATGKFVYKDTFEHSSWCAMMFDRLWLSRYLQTEKSSIYASINEDELYDLKPIMEQVFDKYLTSIAVKVRHENRILKGDKDFHEVFEMLLAFGNLLHKPFKREEDNTSIEEYIYSVIVDEHCAENFELGGKQVTIYPKGAYRIEKINPCLTGLKKLSIRGTLREGNSSGRYYCANIERNSNLHGKLIKVEGIGDDDLGYRYFWCPDDESGRKNGDYFQGIPQDRQDTKFVPFPNLLDFEPQFNNCVDEGGIAFSNGKKPVAFIQHIFKLQNIVTNTNALILDYFAGSGTTGHAVLHLNREDGGNRKYILVEMGEYFNTVTLPRMKNVTYSADWKNGKPQNRNTGVSHIMKYITLESYEDTLSNIELDNGMHDLYTLMGEDYMIHYMFNYEAKDSMLSLEAFSAPFNYKLKIVENNETKDKTVDLCETFNYLIGLSVVRQSALAYFRAVPDDKGEYAGAVKLERDDSGEYGFKQIEGRTPVGKRALIIWRTVTKDLLQSNAALDAYFTKHRNNPADREFDVIYVNGDNNLENLRLDDESWKVQHIEPVFKEKMFEEAE